VRFIRFFFLAGKATEAAIKCFTMKTTALFDSKIKKIFIEKKKA
jgi:hypothetical protein